MLSSMIRVLLLDRRYNVIWGLKVHYYFIDKPVFYKDLYSNNLHMNQVA